MGLLSVGAQADQTTGISTAIDDLQSIVTDLEASQGQVVDLRTQLEALEAASADHVADLEAQETLLDRYRTSVADLEAHDRASLDLAKELRQQLETERAVNHWLLPVAGAALATALVEGFLLCR